jgi:hypothetical protein
VTANATTDPSRDRTADHRRDMPEAGANGNRQQEPTRLGGIEL